jgi:hypothetical protein
MDSKLRIRGEKKMKATNYNLVRYDADDGFVFDWKEPRFIIDENGKEIQEHLYVKTLFIGHTDNIENYIEVGEADCSI